MCLVIIDRLRHEACDVESWLAIQHRCTYQCGVAADHRWVLGSC